MKRTFNYPVTLIEQIEGGFVVEFPDFPEAITQGDSLDEALMQAEDCLEEAIANRMELKMNIPFPSQKDKAHYEVTPNTTLTGKAALYILMQNNKLTNSSVAKKLDCDEKEVRRLVDPHYKSKLPRIEEALHALGQRFEISIVSVEQGKKKNTGKPIHSLH